MMCTITEEKDYSNEFLLHWFKHPEDHVLHGHLMLRCLMRVEPLEPNTVIGRWKKRFGNTSEL